MTNADNVKDTCTTTAAAAATRRLETMQRRRRRQSSMRHATTIACGHSRSLLIAVVAPLMLLLLLLPKRTHSFLATRKSRFVPPRNVGIICRERSPFQTTRITTRWFASSSSCLSSSTSSSHNEKADPSLEKVNREETRGTGKPQTKAAEAAEAASVSSRSSDPIQQEERSTKQGPKNVVAVKAAEETTIATNANTKDNNSQQSPQKQRQPKTSSSSSSRPKQQRTGGPRKYQRRRIPESERQLLSLRQRRQAAFEALVEQTPVASIWSFESLFPAPVWDERSIQRDLSIASSSSSSSSNKKKKKNKQEMREAGQQTLLNTKTLMKSKSLLGGTSMMRIWRGGVEPKQQAKSPQEPPPRQEPQQQVSLSSDDPLSPLALSSSSASRNPPRAAVNSKNSSSNNSKSNKSNNNKSKSRGDNNKSNNKALFDFATGWLAPNGASKSTAARAINGTTTFQSAGNATIDKEMTRLVEDRLYGYGSQTLTGKTSLLEDGAVQFREGVRLGRPLKVNGDRLTYLAKKELSHGRVEEAKELYEQAMQLDPTDGRPYLGLARCAERRRDFSLARDCLTSGIAQSVAFTVDADDNLRPDRGPNPFLLQALGFLEETMGNLAKAEACYVQACRSRPWHAAAWVALGRLRTLKLGQSASAGRKCYQAAEQQLNLAGEKPSSHVYTAWASLEHKRVGDTRRARELYLAALDVDPQCSAAWLQLGVLEGECERYDEAQECFESGLKHDRRNSRLLQAYALMETKRPEGSSRKAIGLFERALAANSRDAGVLQAYALYVADLGDVAAARDLLRRGTRVNKRHAPVWQAWGVLEARQGNAEDARNVFQQGIWACAQPTGSQSGGYPTARLWQAWGVLEAQQGDPAAARRCFSRALDADSRNVPTITAWALMEEQLDNVADARAIYERALKKYMAGTADKVTMWRNYELMEERLGNMQASKQVYERSMRDAFAVTDDSTGDNKPTVTRRRKDDDKAKKKSTEVEVSRWASQGGEVWLNDRAIESKVPMKKQEQQQHRNAPSSRESL